MWRCECPTGSHLDSRSIHWELGAQCTLLSCRDDHERIRNHPIVRNHATEAAGLSLVTQMSGVSNEQAGPAPQQLWSMSTTS